MYLMAVKAQFQDTKARCAAELRVQHGDHVVPVTEALAEFVCMMSSNRLIEGTMR
jgi:hypothetical protein